MGFTSLNIKSSSEVFENSSINISAAYFCSPQIKELKERDASLSYCLALKNNSYIVLASDSRSCVTANTPPHAILSFVDNFEKIVYLPKAEIAFISAGKNRFGDIPFADFLRCIENNLAGKSLRESLEHVSKSIQPHLAEGNVVNLLAVKSLDAEFCDIHKDEIIGCNTVSAMWRAGQIGCGIDAMYLDDKGNLKVNVSCMSLCDMVDFAKHIINTQMEFNRYTGNVPLIGGEVQIMAFSKDGKIFQE